MAHYAGMLRRAILVLLVIWVAAVIARVATTSERGLRGQYFRTADWGGAPSARAQDTEFSARQLSSRWGFAPPESFSVQWSGYLTVTHPGQYVFSLEADDLARLYIGRRLVAENGRDGRIDLPPGAHAVTLHYAQRGGPYRLQWRWRTEGASMRTIPGWRLTPRPRSLASLIALLALDWAWRALSLALVALTLVWRWRLVVAAQDSNHPGPSVVEVRPSRTRAAWAAGSLAVFVTLAVVHTWPLATNPAGLSRNDNADTQLNEWTLAWVAHQLPRDPRHLADANIFYPHRDTLAYSETLIAQSLMGAPLLWLGASPVLTYNILLIAGFALTGWTMSLVVTRWTSDRLAGVAAGALVAFNAHTLTRLPHLQAQHVEFLPLALLAVDSLLCRARWRSALWLACWFTLQALTSAYLLAFTAISLVVGVAVRPNDWMGHRFRGVAPRLAAAALLSGIALLPFLLPYWRLNVQGLERSLDEVARYSASVADYATGASHVHRWLGLSAGGSTALFPGVMALLLAAVAVVSKTAFLDRRARMSLAFAIAGVYLSFGPLSPGYSFLYEHVPLIRALRATARFGYLTIVGIAVLGGFGLATLRRRGPRFSPVVAVVLALVIIEPLAAPLGYQPFTPIPSIYLSLRQETAAVVVELPFPPPGVVSRNGRYMLNSTQHWKPMLNGYSGFIPPSYSAHYEQLRSFPNEDAVEALRSAGVTHAFVHLDQLTPAELATLRSVAGLAPLQQQAEVGLYRVQERAPRGPDQATRMKATGLPQ